MFVDEFFFIAQKRTVKIDVLLSGQLHIKAGAKFNERCNGSHDLTGSLCRFKNAGNDFEHRGLAGSVCSYEAKGFSSLNLKANVVKGPKLLEIKLMVGKGNKVLFQGIVLLGRNVENFADMIDFYDRLCVLGRKRGAHEVIFSGYDNPCRHRLRIALRIKGVDVEMVATGLIKRIGPAGIGNGASKLMLRCVPPTVFPTIVSRPHIVETKAFRICAFDTRSSNDRLANTHFIGAQ